MSIGFFRYRDSVRESLDEWPELSWLNRFLQTPSPVGGSETSAQVFDLIGTHFIASPIDGTPGSLANMLNTQSQDSRFRVVLLCHGDSWNVERDVVDVIGDRYDVDPRVMAKHFDYREIKRESNCPVDIRQGLVNVDRDYISNKYTWKLGGDLICSLSTPLNSWFSFNYDHECLSFVVRKDSSKTTLLVLLRASQDSLIDMSRVFWYHSNAHGARSNFQKPLHSASLGDYFVSALLDSEFSEATETSRILTGVILPYVTNLTSCCVARYHRELAPAVLRARSGLRVDEEILFDDIRQTVVLRRQIESFLHASYVQGTEMDRTTKFGFEACRLLCELTEDLERLRSSCKTGDRSSQTEYLEELMQAQVDEVKASKATSEQLGLLSRLAYVFLPLQLTTSVLGMNLRDFGSGQVELRTFLVVLSTITSLSFVPLLFPLVFGPPWKRIPQVYEISRYSLRVGLLFGWFCFFHSEHINDRVWESGIEWDVKAFEIRSAFRRDIGSEKWTNRRRGVLEALERQHFSFFPGYWQTLLDKLFEIVDSPGWQGRATRPHAA
ncbi:hypothetical protein EV356DRAFT_332540 [Viridothelium virens]|uniref:Uncharacterized protein n=1 Tax=Viridothelium virens TaxID=1048519 RepID=A0A6A6HJF0_VIRVR|nr:hypothetical protein EV356DRAFT_332540 [Viridothelium virens]